MQPQARLMQSPKEGCGSKGGITSLIARTMKEGELAPWVLKLSRARNSLARGCNIVADELGLRDETVVAERIERRNRGTVRVAVRPVSYTHLTLPTNREG